MDNGYIIQIEPQYKQRSYYWKTAIGLQQVDNLTPSDYLIETANANIKGEISLDEVSKRIATYYENKPKITQEADTVSLNIVKVLANNTFKLSPFELLSIHKQLFCDVFPFAGKIRDCNLSKEEWVLNGESVIYGDFYTIMQSLEYDFEKEKAFDYHSLDEKQTIMHIARFISDLWQIHPFREGNTRTIAVFTVKYLRVFGYDVENDIFEKNSLYFRNSLVRANYNNRKKGIIADFSPLEHFFENMLLKGEYKLKSREISIKI
ncbi:MAG: Fic family protein [Oscillospiraceae bacterium]|jgi:fido (protein-threonine AMPylation protein)|nr:Fic family protein [Oscillospiraceae bacterium]